jgi:hypothetical protein
MPNCLSVIVGIVPQQHSDYDSLAMSNLQREIDRAANPPRRSYMECGLRPQIGVRRTPA